jgi:hypothetical protein
MLKIDDAFCLFVFENPKSNHANHATGKSKNLEAMASRPKGPVSHSSGSAHTTSSKKNEKGVM